MSDGLLMRALKAKGLHKFQLDQTAERTGMKDDKEVRKMLKNPVKYFGSESEATSGATKAGRANMGTGSRTTAKSPAGVQKTASQAAAEKAALRKKIAAKVAAKKKK